MTRALCVAAVLVGACCPYTPARGQAFTKRQVVDIALRYCEAVGVPVDTAPEVTFPDPMGAYYFRPVWKVAFPDQAEVEVADGTGVVRGFHNSGMTRALIRHPVGRAMSETDGVRRATEALRATGNREDLVFRQVMLENHGDGASHYWYVQWRRTWKGVPYRDDFANVMVQAETGAILGLGLPLRSQRPSSLVVRVTVDSAPRPALTQMAAVGRADSTPEALELQVVRPNGFYAANGAASNGPGPSRVAWVCRFFRIEREWERHYDVFVDAETGAVIGGESGGPMGYNHPPALGRRFETAREVRVYGRGRNGAWTAKPIATISARANPGVFAALVQTGAPAPPPKAFGNFKVSIVSDDPGPFDLAYVEGPGVIGWGPQWTAAPEEFRALIGKVARAAK